jgi:ribosomal protein L32
MKPASEKKCPSCGHWTAWNRAKDDVCAHCGAALSDYEQKKEARNEKMRAAPSGLFPVHPNDSLVLKIGKYTLNGLNIIFTAIVSFIVWLITFVAA